MSQPEPDFGLETIFGISQPMSLLTSRKTVEWYTPPEVIGWVRAILGGIELDPASSEVPQKWIRADRIYNKRDNGLTKIWKAKTIFLNPPFDKTPEWVSCLTSQFERRFFGHAILLCNTNAGYTWWTEVFDRFPCCLLRERLRFIKEDGTVGGQAKKGQTLALLSRHSSQTLEMFSGVLSPHGKVIMP